MPRPSSLTLMTTADLSRVALTTSRPTGDFPAATRASAFDAVIDGVPEHVDERIADLVEHRAIELDLFAFDDELDLLAKRAGGSRERHAESGRRSAQPAPCGSP
jgi:hypothetical protein